MARHFKELDECKRFLMTVVDLIEKDVCCPTGAPDEVHALADYGLTLKNISGTLATCYAGVKKLTEEKKLEMTEIAFANYPEMGFNERKAIVEGSMADELATLLLAERLERRMSHTSDLIRSIISMYRTELQINKA